MLGALQGVGGGSRRRSPGPPVGGSGHKKVEKFGINFSYNWGEMRTHYGPRKSKLHCKRGHQFDATNTYTWTNGARQCRECLSARGKKYRESKTYTDRYKEKYSGRYEGRYVQQRQEQKMERMERTRARKLALGPCLVCGEARLPCLDLHHVNPNEKTWDISRLLDRATDARFQKEVEKCVVLCSNCHRIWHYEERVGGSGIRES